MRISVIVDSKNSWFIPYAKQLSTLLQDKHESIFINELTELQSGDIAFFLSCTQICPRHLLELHRSNIVIHASNLPQGKGWSPMPWQILEGKNEVYLTMFEAVGKVDSGPIYKKDIVFYEGHELLDELREKMAQKIIEMAMWYVENFPVEGDKQEGEESFYPRRTPMDSELDPNKSIAEQFNLMRISDNERYPLFFIKDGYKYILKIHKENE